MSSMVSFCVATWDSSSDTRLLRSASIIFVDDSWASMPACALVRWETVDWKARTSLNFLYCYVTFFYEINFPKNQNIACNSKKKRNKIKKRKRESKYQSRTFSPASSSCLADSSDSSVLIWRSSVALLNSKSWIVLSYFLLSALLPSCSFLWEKYIIFTFLISLKGYETLLAYIKLP